MTEQAGALRVAVVEDDRVTREGLRLLLDGTPGYRCTAAFGSVEDARRGVADGDVDVVLLDINLPGVSGADGVGLIHERFPNAAVLMLTVFEDQDQVFRSLCNGACGYLLKKTPPARLLEYVSEAASGGGPMSPEIAAKVISLFRELPVREPLGCRLTPQEGQVLALLARGYSYQGSAGELGVSVNTVRNYVRSIYDKLHVHTKSEAVSKAIRAGII